MRIAFILPVLLLGTSACGEADTSGGQNSASAETDNLGALCGVPDLVYHIEQEPQPTLFLDEPRTSGTLEYDGGNRIELAPASEREQRVSRATNCLHAQATKRGLQISWPVNEFVN